jgi:hypothetical protein
VVPKYFFNLKLEVIQMALKGDGVKTKKRGFVLGYGLLMDLITELPRKYDEKMFGNPDGKGLVITGKVVRVLGGLDTTVKPAVGDVVSVTIRPEESRSKIYDDMDKTRESTRFLLESVSGEIDTLESGWVHGAGDNRDIQALQIVGVPSITFENPVMNDGPRNGSLRLNLDGSPTEFSEHLSDGTWVDRVMPYDEVVSRLKDAFTRNLKFKVTQRTLAPKYAKVVEGQAELDAALKEFRAHGYTSCVVRTFIPGTTDPRQVDTQVMNWPEDIPADGNTPAKIYDLPMLRETKRFAALRDGEVEATMEVIPGAVLNLVGNPSDASKSVKHKFVETVVGKGHSSAQKGLYGAQSYGPGISISARNDEGKALGLTRLCTRTEGIQYRTIADIPTSAFPTADKLDYTVKVVEPGTMAPADAAEEATV